LPDDANFPVWFVVARSVHFMACLLILAIFVFDRLIVPPTAQIGGDDIGPRWQRIARRLFALAFPLALLSGAVWFAIVSVEMSGLPWREAISGEVLGLVWNQTHFGQLWKLRALAALASLLVMPMALLDHSRKAVRAAARWAALLLAALLCGSLAWAGHGQTGGPRAWHLAADTVHLLVSGCWPAGLLPFAMLLVSLRRTRQTDWQPPVVLLVRRFSAMAVVSVLLLTATGVANSWFLVGSLPAVTTTSYGLVLVAKIVGFCAMVGFGAVNLLRVMPRLTAMPANSASDSVKEQAIARLLNNVVAEVILAAIVFVLVGILGMLPPPAEHHAHHHHGENAASTIRLDELPAHSPRTLRASLSCRYGSILLISHATVSNRWA